MPDTTLLILLAVIVVLLLFVLNKKKPPTNKTVKIEAETESNTKEPLNLNGAYQKRWLFSYNEKDTYYKIKEVADKLNLKLLAKVRLLDLLEPVKGTPKYKTFFYKVQSKHVDFVLCDEKLVAKYVIELDDSSHDEVSRQQRDNFVDTILTNVGYKILHTRSIVPNEIEQFLKS